MKLLAAIVRHVHYIEWRGIEQKLAQILSLYRMQTASKQLFI